jgi:DNA polymerase V
MRRHVFALIDCNNFYVSCERSFNAAIQNTPVIVMSNNDGCVVARSSESKKLGIKMGQPVFECQALIKQHGIQLFSSNYSLYADMSDDEAFLELTDLSIDDLTAFGRTNKSRVQQFTGIPVSVGIAPTKSLTKIANEMVKKG